MVSSFDRCRYLMVFVLFGTIQMSKCMKLVNDYEQMEAFHKKFSKNVQCEICQQKGDLVPWWHGSLVPSLLQKTPQSKNGSSRAAVSQFFHS